MIFAAVFAVVFRCCCFVLTDEAAVAADAAAYAVAVEIIFVFAVFFSTLIAVIVADPWC